MRVLVTGAGGQLGTDVVRALEDAGATCVRATRRDGDFADPSAAGSLVARTAPDAVVNCAAFHDVAGCEDDPELAWAVNAHSVGELGRACEELGASLMTVSTDYVFDGRKEGGYTERDDPEPLNVYGSSKLEGERLARAMCSRAFVVRTQSLFGLARPTGKGRNFVELILALAQERDELKVDQFRMGPTSTAALAANMTALLRTEHHGLYHMSCDGETTWYEFAKRIVELAGIDVRVVPVANDYYPARFVRPEATYLVNEALGAIGLDLMPSWEDALEAYLRSREPLATAGSTS